MNNNVCNFSVIPHSSCFPSISNTKKCSISFPCAEDDLQIKIKKIKYSLKKIHPTDIPLTSENCVYFIPRKAFVTKLRQERMSSRDIERLICVASGIKMNRCNIKTPKHFITEVKFFEYVRIIDKENNQICYAEKDQLNSRCEDYDLNLGNCIHGKIEFITKKVKRTKKDPNPIEKRRFNLTLNPNTQEEIHFDNLKYFEVERIKDRRTNKFFCVQNGALKQMYIPKNTKVKAKIKVIADTIDGKFNSLDRIKPNKFEKISMLTTSKKALYLRVRPIKKIFFWHTLR